MAALLMEEANKGFKTGGGSNGKGGKKPNGKK
jgi:hypothetical protein